MAGFETAKALLHKIRVALLPNYLVGGKYVARTENERTIGIEEICQNMRERGRFEGDYDAAFLNVREFLDESVFLLCDGWGVNLGYMSITPHIAGSWDSAAEAHDRVKHPVRFTYRTLKPLRDIAESINVEVTNVEDQTAYIDSVTDYYRDITNEDLTAFRNFNIKGNKIAVSGDPSVCGLFIVELRVDGEYPFRVSENLIKNSKNEIIAMLPDYFGGGEKVKIRIITDFTGGAPLKEPRTLEFDHVFSILQPIYNKQPDDKQPDDKQPDDKQSDN
jgi:hypothetical protein